MQALYDYAETLNVEIVYASLHARDGEYRHDLKRIRLSDGMATRLGRSVLAHELAHAWYADVPQGDPVMHAKQERRADEWAALELISADAYIGAERTWEGHIPSMAHELGVVSWVVEAYQRVLDRTLLKRTA